MAVVREENLPLNQWRLGRVEEVFRGKVDLMRVADICTCKGIIRRQVVKLVGLSTDSTQ